MTAGNLRSQIRSRHATYIDKVGNWSMVKPLSYSKVLYNSCVAAHLASASEPLNRHSTRAKPTHTTSSSSIIVNMRVLFLATLLSLVAAAPVEQHRGPPGRP